jgi:transcriptional regulator GlxA family with amidase domain
MRIAILTFQGFNEIDSFVALGILNRVRRPGWNAFIACPEPHVTSMNGVAVQAQGTLEDAIAADAVLVGSGTRTRDIAKDPGIMALLAGLDLGRQLIGAQCSGTLLLAKLGLLAGLPACTDLVTAPWVVEAGVEVSERPFLSHGNVATAGGCLASHYLAAWFITRGAGEQAARRALHYVAPVGEKDAYVERAMRHVGVHSAAEEPSPVPIR